jgi:hypothetical protein
MEIQVQPCDVVRGKGLDLMFFQKVSEMLRRKGENDFEVKGRALPLNNIETEIPKLAPVGVASFRLLVEEVFIKESVQGKFVKGCDLSLYK